MPSNSSAVRSPDPRSLVPRRPEPNRQAPRSTLARAVARRAHPAWSLRERVPVSVFVLLCAVALLAPALPTPAMAMLGFADGRHWHGLANAMDVLSNLPFALLGLWGLLRLRGRGDPLAPLPGPTLACAQLFFAGLLLTAAGSAFYHLQPDALRLAADRAGMAVAFAGLIGLAACERVSLRAGRPMAWATLAAGLMAVAVCAQTGNVLPWALLQFGGLALVLWLALLSPVSGAMGLRLGGVIGCYALAKAFEMGDHAVYELTGHLLSGHTLKHLVAAGAAWPVLRMLGRQRQAPAAQS